MSEVMARLTLAHFNIEALVDHRLESERVAISLELVSHGAWTVLVILDECRLSLRSFKSARGYSPERWSLEGAPALPRVSGGIQRQSVDRAVS
jgi:hypothetical protein